MNVNSVMNTYNLSSLLNSNMGVPLVSNINSAVNENYEIMNLSGQNTNSELQDIYQQVEPTLNMPITYDQNGNINFQSNTSLPSNASSLVDSNVSNLLQDSNLTNNSFYSNVLSQYDAIKNGTYQMSLSSILSSNPTDNNQSALINQMIGNNLDVSV